MSQTVGDAHTPQARAPHLSSRAAQKFWGFLLGHDIFISHSHRDAKYALRLARLMSDEGFICYLDQLATRPGAEVPEHVLVAARRSSCFVLVASPPALGSRHVEREFQTFLDVPHSPNKPRNVVVINVEGALAGAPAWVKRTEGLTHEGESRAAVDDGRPSAGVLGRVSESCKYNRRTRQVKRFFFVLLAAAVLLIAGTGAASAYIVGDALRMRDEALTSLKQAQEGLQVAETKRTEAVKKQDEAIKAQHDAETDAARAEEARADAQVRAEQARALEAQARDNAAAARQQQLAAERLQRQATAERIAADAEREKEDYPQRGLLLSLKALEATRADESPAPGAVQALYDTLGRGGGQKIAVFPRGPHYHNEMDFIQNGRLLYAASDEGLNLLDFTADSPRLRSVPSGSYCTDRKFSPDGVWLAQTCDEKRLLWNLTSADAELRPTDPAKLRLPADRVSDGLGRWLLSAGVIEPPPPTILTGENSSSPPTETAPGWGNVGVHTQANSPGVKTTHFEHSDDWRWVVLFDAAPAVKVYDMNRAPSERLVKTIEGASETFSPATFPGGGWLLTRGPDGGAQLWDLTKLRPDSAPVILPGLSVDLGLQLKFSPDGRWLVVSDFSTQPGREQLFYLGGGDVWPGPTLNEDNDRGQSPEFSPDNRFLMLKGERRVKFLRLGLDDARRPRAEQFNLIGQDSFISSVEFADDGKWMVAFTEDGRALLRRLPADDHAGDDIGYYELSVLRVAEGKLQSGFFTSDGRWLVTTAGRVVALWDLEPPLTPGPPIILRGHEDDIEGVAYSPYSRLLVTNTANNETRVWNLRDVQPSAQPRLLDSPDKGGYAFAPGGNWVVSYAGEGVFKLWDLRTDGATSAPFVLPTTKPPEGANVKALFSRDGRWLMTSGDGVNFKVWDIRSPKPSALPFKIVVASKLGIPGPSDLQLVESELLGFSPDSRLLATNVGGGGVRVWDLPGSDAKGGHFDLKTAGDDVHTFSFSQDSRWLALISKRGARLCDLRARGAGTCADLGPDVLAVRFSTGGRWVYSLNAAYDEERFTFKDGKAKVWSLSEGGTLRQIAEQSGGDLMPFLSHAGFSSDGRWLSLSVESGGVFLWDLRSKKPRPPLRLVESRNIYNLPDDASFSPDARWLVTSAGESGLTLWDLRGEGAPRARKLKGLDERSLVFTFSPNSRWLIAGRETAISLDRAAIVWDLRNGAKAHLLEGAMVDPAHDLPSAFSPDNRWLVTMVTKSSDRVPAFWDLTLADPFERPAALGGTYVYFNKDAFSPTGEWFAGYVQDDGDRGGLYVWNMKAKGAPGVPIFIPSKGAEWSKGWDWRSTFGFTPGGRFLFSVGPRLALWTMNHDKLLKLARDTAGRDLREFEGDPLGWTTPAVPAKKSRPSETPLPPKRGRATPGVARR